MLTDIRKCNIQKSIFPSGNLFPDFHRVNSIYHAGPSVPRFSNVNSKESHLFSADKTALTHIFIREMIECCICKSRKSAPKYICVKYKIYQISGNIIYLDFHF